MKRIGGHALQARAITGNLIANWGIFYNRISITMAAKFWILVLLIGCSNLGRNAQLIRQESSNADSSFEFFFRKFSTDSIFQVSRVSFPLAHSFYDETVDRMIKENIDKAKWRYTNFTLDSLGETKKFGAYSVEIVMVNSGKVEYRRKGIDNGINQIFYFENKNALWFLVELLDRST